MDKFEINGLVITELGDPEVTLVKTGHNFPDEYEFRLQVGIKVTGPAGPSADAVRSLRHLLAKKISIVNPRDELH